MSGFSADWHPADTVIARLRTFPDSHGTARTMELGRRLSVDRRRRR
jgi:hypothetical protein